MKTCLFNDWEFCIAECIQPDFSAMNTYAWRRVCLPHDWSTDYPFDQEADSCGSGGYAKTGIGWYRRSLRFYPQEKERVILYFEGVYMKSRVYVNGKLAGSHIYGYTPFEVDITDLLTDGENELFVSVDNSKQPGSRWYSGSGITRDVWLETRPQLHFARYGVYTVSEETETADNVLLHTELTVHAESEEACSPIQITYRLTDWQGNQTAKGKIEPDDVWEKASEEAAVMTGKDEPVSEELHVLSCRFSIPIERPVRWSHKTPALYTLFLTLECSGRVLEEREVPVGIRSIAFDANRGFLLNGIPVKLNGVCLHHDGGCVGAAVPSAIWERRLKKLKEMGVNAIRCAHNPPDPALLTLCDRMGLFVIDEAFDEWKQMKLKEIGSNTHESHGYSMYFEECYEWDLKTMLYRDRNHPSIILWSIGNEIPEEVMEGGERLAIRMRKICHAIDPSRRITLAHDQIAAEPYAARQEFLDEIDVVGYNYVGRWRERAELFYDEDREKYPHRCVIGTENPSAGYIRGMYRFEYDRNSFWDKPYYTAAVAAGKLLRYTMTHAFVAGDFMWTGIDYLGESHWPERSSGCGCLDTCGFEKDSFYFYKSIWRTEEPFAYLCPHWNLSLAKGTVIPVICYTNCEDAELFVNGKSYGVKSKGFPCYGMTERYGHFDRWRRPANTDDLFLSWDVPYEPGEIEVVGSIDGQELCRYRIETAGESAVIAAETDTPILKADGRQIAQIVIRILDAQGRLTPTACPKLNFTLEGEGEILGIDNGNPSCHEQWKETKGRSAFHGMAYVVIRSGINPGTLRLRVESADGEPVLRAAEIEIFTC